jgi:hypothetical protein
VKTLSKNDIADIRVQYHNNPLTLFNHCGGHELRDRFSTEIDIRAERDFLEWDVCISNNFSQNPFKNRLKLCKKVITRFKSQMETSAVLRASILESNFIARLDYINSRISKDDIKFIISGASVIFNRL